MLELETPIIFNKKIAARTYLMGIRSEDLAAQAKPGQFVMIRVSPTIDPLLRRPFSICAVRAEDLTLILYRVVGKGTRIMSRSKEGDPIHVLGPLGRGFEIPEEKSETILVAGGIGLAPLIFLLRAMGEEAGILLIGYRSENEVVLLEEVGLAGKDVRISTDDGTAGHHGPVTDLLEKYMEMPDVNPSGIFACGPLPMLKKVSSMALQKNIPCHVSLESAMACGLGACQGCAVKAYQDEKRPYLHVCKDGPVFDAQLLDWDRL